MVRLCCITLLCVSPLTVSAADPIDFQQDIQPLFQTHCADCHGAADQNGGLRLDRAETAFAPADSGRVAIVAGDPDHSELIARVTSTDDDLRMPPEGDRLSETDVDRLRDWIRSGAVWSTNIPVPIEIASNSTHWAFQPIKDSSPLQVEDENWPHSDWPHSDWPHSELDRYVQARREQAGLMVAADASAQVMIRRMTFGLTGLPATIQEIETFEQRVKSVGQSAAIAECVDQLLSRPSYGERWGRHWMDWVRYADTAGDNSDFPIPQAYLYRNYIIQSLNDDLPYDRFLTEQIAGDLLPASTLEERNRQTIATGYLAMARRFGSLVERYPWHLTIEDTIDNIGRATMGLTLACARCHDHKFDPISTRDYYALYGIFASTRYPFPGLELFQTQRDFVSLLDPAETAARLQEYQPEIDKLAADLQQHLDRCESKSLENAGREKECSVDEQRKMRDELDQMLIKARRSGEKLADYLRAIPDMPVAYAVKDTKSIDAAIQIKGEPSRPGAIVARGFPEVLGGWKLDPEHANHTSGRLQLANWIASADNPLTARVIVNRVWQRHFGTGIVPSTSDFGLRGELPTNPELLDWLADDFIRHGWSLKHLHRRIMTSHTYALASDGPTENLAIDPNNHFLWRFNRQRLDAESIRDSALLIAGNLDGTPQTEPYPFPPRDKWEFTQHHPFKDDYASDKRSVYLMTKRLTAKPYFQTFDGPDPNACTSSRDQSVTALQALYFVNDAFMHEQATEFASSIRRLPGDRSQRIQFAVQSILGRPPRGDEIALLSDHLAAVMQRTRHNEIDQQETAAWASLVRSLFRLNEFLYVD